MQAKTKRIIKNTARAGANGVGSILLFILRAIGTVLLIILVTGALFAVIFVNYIETNLLNSPDLEVTLEDMKLDLSSTIYYKDSTTGKYEELVTLESTDNRIWVDYDDIPLDLEHAVVSIEDKRFYKHHGVDWYRTAGAFVNMFIGMKNTFGGSTITQQLIKNRTGDSEATVTRKLSEIFRALEFEKTYTKEDIIEWYLNIVYFGHRRYGIGAAADFYFGKEVGELSLAEMASIVGITNNPSIYSPYVNRESNKKRQETILHEMWTQGYITTEQQYRDAVAEELHFQPWTESNNTGVTVYSYYVDTVISDVIQYFMETRGVTTVEAERLLYHGGYKIYSCIDLDIQAKVDAVYQDLAKIPETTRTEKQLQSAIVIMDPYSGDIVALSGGVGTDKVARGLNRASGSLARRPTGSSIKPLSLYGIALDLNIITPDTTFEDEPDIQLQGTTWYPKNDDLTNDGVVSVRTGVIKSKNTVAAQVLDKVGAQYSYNFLTETLHFTSLVPDDVVYPALAMGQETYGITPREMASGFTMFVNNGVYTEGRTFSAIYDSEGELVGTNIPYSTAAISEAAAYWMTDMLKDAVRSGTGYEAYLGAQMPVAGKTGTSSGYKDRWFVGYTPYYVGAVWTGYDKPERIYLEAGGNPAAQLWKKVMTAVHEDLEYKKFNTPSNTRLTPVIGVGEAVPFYIRGIVTDADGNVTELYHEETYDYYDTSSKHTHKYASGRTVTVIAKEVEGYILTSEPYMTLTLDKNLVENVAEFVYTPIAPPEPEIPDEPEIDPEDPENNLDDPDMPTEPDEEWTPVENGEDTPTETENGENQGGESQTVTEQNTGTETPAENGEENGTGQAHESEE